uniref:Uncharacterized protein n=1 Tax=Salix viminalis TaxID=40686 RepID=A0A6N2LBN7_SALVM
MFDYSSILSWEFTPSKSVSELGLSTGIQGNEVAEESSDNASDVEVRESFLDRAYGQVRSCLFGDHFLYQWQPSSITEWQNPEGLRCRELYHRLNFFAYTCLDVWTSKMVCMPPNCDCDLTWWRTFWGPIELAELVMTHVAAR